jgi:hypothetical protein
METIKMEWTGIRPLLMTNPQTIKLSNSYSIASRRLNTALKDARKKQDEVKMLEIEKQAIRNDFESSAYWDEDKKEFYLTDSIVMATIKCGAQACKKGKDVERGLIITETEIYIEHSKKFKSLEQAFENSSYRLEVPCKIPPKTGALIWKARCMIPTGWKIVFNIEYDDDIIATKSVIDANVTAGIMSGVGGWRPKFGRFTAKAI